MKNFAMLGVWHVHARDYARHINSFPGCRILSVWDRDEAAAARFAQEHGGSYAKLEEILSDGRIEGLVVTTATSEEDLETVYKSMKLMGIEELGMKHYNELSAGQHQKVAIARGLVQGTDFIILDEPTANLDVRYQIYVTELLKELAVRSGMTVLMISHDLNITARYADEVIVMARPGVIHSMGKPEDVITEDMIREVYGVDCDVIDAKGKPHIILGPALRID